MIWYLLSFFAGFSIGGYVILKILWAEVERVEAREGEAE